MSNRVQQRQPSPQNQQSIVLESQRSHSLNQMITLPQKRKEHVREKKNPITAGREWLENVIVIVVACGISITYIAQVGRRRWFEYTSM